MVIYRHERESYIGLVEAHWSARGTQVGLLVCNMFAQPLMVGYDFQNGSTINGTDFRPALELQIVQRYSVPKGRDPIGWACSAEGNAAYASSRVK